eukprot:7382004-Prymnesium_polylepis.2
MRLRTETVLRTLVARRVRAEFGVSTAQVQQSLASAVQQSLASAVPARRSVRECSSSCRPSPPSSRRSGRAGPSPRGRRGSTSRSRDPARPGRHARHPRVRAGWLTTCCLLLTACCLLLAACYMPASRRTRRPCRRPPRSRGGSPS